MGKQKPDNQLRKSQFEGKKGRLMLQLQKSYKGDQRFKLTQKFKGDIQVDKLKNSFRQIVDKEVLDLKQQQIQVQQQDEYVLERKNQLSILDTVLPTRTKHIHKNPKEKIKSVQQLIVTRFDPSSLKGSKMIEQIEKNKRRKEIEKRTIENKQKKKHIKLEKGVDKGKMKIDQANKLLSSLKQEQSTDQVIKPKEGFFMKWTGDKQEAFQPREFKLFG